MDGVIQQFEIPTQSCILTHVTNQIQLIEKGAPVDLVFQSIAGTELANKSFGIDISIIESSQVTTELLYKLMNEFLETRGTKVSFEILFRMMFNKQVEILFRT